MPFKNFVHKPILTIAIVVPLGLAVLPIKKAVTKAVYVPAQMKKSERLVQSFVDQIKLYGQIEYDEEAAVESRCWSSNYIRTTIFDFRSGYNNVCSTDSINKGLLKRENIDSYIAMFKKLELSGWQRMSYAPWENGVEPQPESYEELKKELLANDFRFGVESLYHKKSNTTLSFEHSFDYASNVHVRVEISRSFYGSTTWTRYFNDDAPLPELERL